MENVVAQFDIAGFTAQQYSKTLKDLESAGLGHPKGRLYHIAVQKGKGMLVTDVWESEKALEDFSKTLIPVLEKNGVTPAKPTLLPIYNILM
jgi:predicted transcriptional regulator